MYIIEKLKGSSGDTRSTLKVWYASTDDKLLAILDQINRSGQTIYLESTPALELEISGLEPGDEGFDAVKSLIDNFRADTPIFRADYMIGENVWQAEPISKRDAAFAYLNFDSWYCEILEDDNNLKAAFESGELPTWLMEEHFPEFSEA